MSVLVAVLVVTALAAIALIAWVVWLNWMDNKTENTIGRDFDHFSGRTWERSHFRDYEEDDRDGGTER